MIRLNTGIIDPKLQSAVFDYLIADEVILNYLVKNKPWYNEKAAATKQASFIPFNKGPLKKTPYLTYQNIGESPTGQFTNSAFFIVRCYNSGGEDYFTINEILSRVKVLLNHHTFSIEGFAAIELTAVSSGTELVDDTYKQNFREVTFQVSYL